MYLSLLPPSFLFDLPAFVDQPHMLESQSLRKLDKAYQAGVKMHVDKGENLAIPLAQSCQQVRVLERLCPNPLLMLNRTGLVLMSTGSLC